MKKITFLLLLISSMASAQKSLLYNNNHRLIADTSFKIDEHTYKNLEKIEGEVLPEIYGRIRLQWIGINESGSGMVIVRLAFNKGVCTFEVVRSKVTAFEDAVYMACKGMKKEYDGLGRNENYLLYVPVRFEGMPNKFNKLLNQNNAITIQREEFGNYGFKTETKTEDWINTKN
ncbi:MAG: hypothetical protein H7289_05235 [Mucilaginibacter sp.]|nr:hypothetical protein [Mucilaginibacter sp.]